MAVVEDLYHGCRGLEPSGFAEDFVGELIGLFVDIWAEFLVSEYVEVP